VVRVLYNVLCLLCSGPDAERWNVRRASESTMQLFPSVADLKTSFHVCSRHLGVGRRARHPEDLRATPIGESTLDPSIPSGPFWHESQYTPYTPAELPSSEALRVTPSLRKPVRTSCRHRSLWEVSSLRRPPRVVITAT
jgi:hypothetical protein